MRCGGSRQRVWSYEYNYTCQLIGLTETADRWNNPPPIDGIIHGCFAAVTRRVQPTSGVQSKLHCAAMHWCDQGLAVAPLSRPCLGLSRVRPARRHVSVCARPRHTARSQQRRLRDAGTTTDQRRRLAGDGGAASQGTAGPGARPIPAPWDRCLSRRPRVPPR